MRQAIVVTLLLGVLAFAAIFIADTPARNQRAAAERHAASVSARSTGFAPAASGFGLASLGSWFSGGGTGFSARKVVDGLYGSFAKTWRQALEAEAISIKRTARTEDFIGKLAAIEAIHAPADQDYGAAVARYALAVDPDDADAHYSLGLIYRDGKGVAPDDFAAARHLLAAAERGHGPAQLAMAELYEEGRGVNRNAVAAYVWYDRASTSLNSDRGRLGAAEKRDRLVAGMNPAEIAAARDLVEFGTRPPGRVPGGGLSLVPVAMASGRRRAGHTACPLGRRASGR